MPRGSELISASILEARAYLDRAISRLDELSIIDQERLAYLEQRTVDQKEANEDLFHSVNNALFVMSVNVDLIKRYLRRSSELRPEIARRVEQLQLNVRQLTELNRQLLAMNTTGTGPLYVVQSFISLRVAIQHAVETYADVAQEKNIEIAWTLPEFPAIAIWTDGVGIATVLDNLLSNAIKFSERGTKVTVTMTRKARDLICSVFDQGPGLTPEEIATVFIRGVTAGPKPTAGESSIGYGLAIAREVVESLGGRLWCESEKGKGSAFLFSIPATAEPR